MSFFDAIRNVGSTAINQMQEVPGQIANAPSNAMARIGTNVDFMKALTQNPEEFEKFMLENPDFFKNAEQVGIPELAPPMNFLPSGGFINQNPNFLNSAQQVLTRGY
jgi:hypothetical protein